MEKCAGIIIKTISFTSFKLIRKLTGKSHDYDGEPIIFVLGMMLLRSESQTCEKRGHQVQQECDDTEGGCRFYVC